MRNKIKVIGVGKTGYGIVNYMSNQSINEIDFTVCNTDVLEIENSGVPNKIDLNIQEFDESFDDDTKIALIIAKMGGATEMVTTTELASQAKEREIITIGIVSIPFLSEGLEKYEKALSDIDKLHKQFDSIIVIDNNKSILSNEAHNFHNVTQLIYQAFTKIVKGITATVSHYNFNHKDIKTVLGDGGSSFVGSSVVSGDFRAKNAIKSALYSPLLKVNKITNAENILLLISSGTDEIYIDDISEICDYIQEKAGYKSNIIMGVDEDLSLGESLAVSLIATGIDVSGK